VDYGPTHVLSFRRRGGALTVLNRTEMVQPASVFGQLIRASAKKLPDLGVLKRSSGPTEPDQV
jgi:hypothetical protein